MSLALTAIALFSVSCTEPLPTATLAPVAPALATAATSANLVISQVYGGGGNSGAPYTHDFVEIFNRGTSAVSLAGYSVQYASATGTGNFGANPVTLLSGTLQPGQYYLVRQSGGINGVALPTPDAAGTIAMAAGAGKVVLVNSTTGLACNGGSTPCSAAQLAQIIDLVGYGSANFFEGSGAAPTLTNTTAAFRAGNGCTDTDNNSADFAAAAPAPRNSASPLAPCTPSAPVVTSTVPADGATGVAADANLAVTFDRAVTPSGNWYSITCTVSGAHTAVVSGGPTTYTLDPDTDFAGGENCTATIIAAQVADQASPSLTMATDYNWSFTIGAVNVCTLPYTAAYTIQGSGAATPLASTAVTTQGVVVGDYEGPSPALRGFYLQDLTGDGDPATSDAVFVFNGNNDVVQLGDVVRVTGTATEFQGQTQVSASAVVACGTGTVAPVDVTLPVASATYLEQFEGMLVRLPQTLHVTEHFQLGRFNQVVLSSSERLPQPTNIASPGAAALAVQAQNDLDRLILDDASQGQNPDPIIFARGGLPLSAGNTLRGGDAATGIVGVLTFTWAGNAASGNAYRIRPVGALGGGIPSFVAANPRAPVAPSVGGTLKVAAFNLLNYFNTFGNGACANGLGGSATDCRGASSATEFARQWPKTVAAITGLDADILGVVELENDGYDAASAIADLADKLNAATAPGTWAFIDADAGTGQVNALGIDAIKVGLLYRPARVTPVGSTAALNSAAFVNGGDPDLRNRPALAQAFETAERGRVVVTVNHFKSKGSACAVPDAGDGQGECNAVRVAAASALRDWLATDPTGTGDPDVLILGDLNAYAKEDPVTVLRNAGYRDLIADLIGSGAYSYAFDGQWGYLDHALASPSLAAQVNGVAEWHINADEPSVLDYNVEFKSAGQVASLYSPDAYRTSDHDPVVVGITLTPSFPFSGFLAPVAGPPAVNEARAGSTVPLKFSLGGYRGMNVLASGSPASRQVSCSAGLSGDVSVVADTPGESGLTYDALTDTYQINWKTSRAWAGTCRELLLQLSDGTTHRAFFRFR